MLLFNYRYNLMVLMSFVTVRTQASGTPGVSLLTLRVFALESIWLIEVALPDFLMSAPACDRE